jgi:hypothetical protein
MKDGMGKSDDSLENARNAKKQAAKIFAAFGPIVGVGITRVGDAYAVKVNFEKLLSDPALLPGDIDGVPVVIEVVGKIRKQGGQ